MTVQLPSKSELAHQQSCFSSGEDLIFGAGGVSLLPLRCDGPSGVRGGEHTALRSSVAISNLCSSKGQVVYFLKKLGGETLVSGCPGIPWRLPLLLSAQGHPFQDEVTLEFLVLVK